MIKEASYQTIAIFAVALLLITSIGAYALTGFFTAIPNINCTTDNDITDITPISAVSSNEGLPDWTTGQDTDYIYMPRDANGFYETVNDTKSALYHNNITDFSINLSKVNNPEGYVSVDIYNSSNLVRKHLSNILASGLTNITTSYNSNINSGSGIVLNSGDKLGAKYIDNSTNTQTTFTSAMNITIGGGIISLSAGGGSLWNIQGEWVVNNSSALYNQQANAIMVHLIKVGSPTGTLYAGVWNNSGNKVFSFGSINVRDISSASILDYWFMNQTSSHTFAVNDRIGIQFNSGNSTNYIRQYTDSTGSFDGSNSQRSLWNGSTWNNNSTPDLRMAVTTVAFNSNGHYSLSLDGNDDYVNVGTTTIFPNNTSTVTILALVKTSQFHVQNIISNWQGTGSSGGGWGFYINQHSIPIFAFVDDVDATNRFWTSQIQLSPNQWHFIAIVANSTQGRIYVDDQIDDRPIGLPHSIKINNNQLIHVGDRQQVLNERFKGDIDELMVFNRTLSQSEVLSIRNGIVLDNSSQRLYYKFDEGNGQLVKDYSGNGYTGTMANGAYYTTSSFPNYVKLGITNKALFDNSNVVSDTMHGDKNTWIFGWGEPNTGSSFINSSVLNKTIADILYAQGVDTIVVTGINENVRSDTKYNNIVIPFINYAHSLGMKIIGATFESTDYFNNTLWSDSAIRNKVDLIVSRTNQYFDGYTIDIEPENLADYQANKAFYLERYVHISNVIGSEYHDNPSNNYKIYADTIAVFHDNELATLTNYTNGFDSLANSDFVIIMNYQYNVTNYISAVNPIITARSIPQIYLENVRSSAGATPKMTAYQWALTQNRGSIYNDTYSNYLGTGSYAQPYFIAKTQTHFIKHILTQYLNITNNFDRIFEQKYDLSFNITQGNNSHPASNTIDNDASTYWITNKQGNDLDGEYVYVSINNSKVIDRLVLNTHSDSQIPETLNIYISNNPSSWGVPVYQDSISRIIGNQTIDLKNKLGSYVKVSVSDNGDKFSQDGFSIAEIIPQYLTISQVCVDGSHDDVTQLLMIIPMSGIGAIVVVMLRRQGII